MTDKQREAQRLWESEALIMINADFPMLTAINNQLSNYKQALKKEIDKIYSSNKGKEVAFSEERFNQIIDEVHPL